MRAVHCVCVYIYGRSYYTASVERGVEGWLTEKSNQCSPCAGAVIVLDAP